MEHGIGSGFGHSDHTCLCTGGDQTKLEKHEKKVPVTANII